jgi:hypothetical protein
MAKLGKYTTGVACLYIKHLADVDQKVLRQLVAQSLKTPLPGAEALKAPKKKTATKPRGKRPATAARSRSRVRR